MNVKLEWDKSKAARNLLKHRVEFSAAAMVLEDAQALTIEDDLSQGEQRFISLGQDDQGSVLVVVFSVREEVIRLISARKASNAERKRYEEGIRL